MTGQMLHTYQVGWRFHNKQQMEKETVKLSAFNKLLATLKEKYNVSTKTCAELIIHEIMPDGTVAVRMEFEDLTPLQRLEKQDAEDLDTPIDCGSCEIPPYWASFLEDDTDLALSSIGEALTRKVPIRLPKKNRKLLVKEN